MNNIYSNQVLFFLIQFDSLPFHWWFKPEINNLWSTGAHLRFAFVNKVLLAQSQAQPSAATIQRLSLLTHDLDSLHLVVLLMARLKAPVWH